MPRRNAALTPEQRADARAALALLAERDLSLTDCVRMALQLPGSQPAAAVSIDQAIEAYLSALQVRSTTLKFYQDNLWRFQDDCGARQMAELSPGLVKAYLDGLTGSRPQMYRSLSAWLRWCWRHDPPYLATNIMERVPKPREGAPRRAFMTLDQAAQLLEIPRHRPAVALGMFAGIRMQELARMDWRAVDRTDRIIRIEAEVAKTGRTRLIDKAPDNLWPWLAGAPAEGPVLPIRAFNFGAALRRWLPDFPPNGLRHSFATYHTAAYRSPGETAMILGHESSLQLLYTRYRGLATQAEGRAYFSLKP